jgi:tetratricopeptide (TPR) repeat protein
VERPLTTLSSAEEIEAHSPEELRDLLASGRNPLATDVIAAVRDRNTSLVGANPILARDIARVLCRRVSTDPDPDAAEGRAIAYRARAEAGIFCGRLGDAARDYGLASREAEFAGAEGLLGQILVGWIGVLAAQGKADELSSLARRAERLLQSSGDREYMAKLHMNLGNLAYHEERYEDAFSWYRRALTEMATAGREDATWVALLVNQAVACCNTGRLHEARVLFQRATTRAESLGLYRFLGEILLNRSYLDRLSGDYRSAVDLVRRASEHLLALDAVDLAASARLNQAEMLLELGMARDAADLALDAAQSFDHQEMRIDAAICRLVVARAAVELGDHGSAHDALEHAEAEFRRQQAWPRLATLRLTRARSLRAQGNRGASLVEARAALRTFERRRMTGSMAAARALIVACHLEEGRLVVAENEVRHMSSHVARLNPGERASWLRTSAAVARAAGRPSVARTRLRRAVTALEEQRRLIPGLELRASAFRDQVRVYHDYVDLLVDGGRPRFDEVLTLVEAARGRTFRDRQRIPGEARAALAGDRARLGALTRRLDDLELNPTVSAGDDELRRVREDVRALERAISHRLQRIDPELGDELPSAPIDGIRARLRPRDGLVEYFLTGDRVLALILTGSKAEVVTLPVTAPEVEGSLSGLVHLLATMSVTATESFGNLPFLRHVADRGLGELYQQLLAPLEPLLAGCDRLVLVPHGILHEVPFECLHTGREYVGESRTVVRIATAASLLDGTPRSTPAKWTRALVSGTVEGGPAMVGTELTEVADRLGRDRTDVLVDAGSEELLGRLADADVIHLAAHGVFRSDNPAFSHLTTADGGLFVADLLGSSLRADLVVLSACNTGRVFSGAGDDLSGVAHAFLAAGARQLVASLWRVHDGATLALMRAFYDALAEDPTDVPGALSVAAGRVRAEWDHPFFWGGFCVHGL